MDSTSPKKASRARDEVRIYFAVVAATVVAFFLRGPGKYLHPQLWAEDGTIFFKDAFEQGAVSIFNAHEGYQLLLPRVVACVGVATGAYADVPAMWAWTCALIAAAILAVFATRLYESVVPQRWLRVLVCLAAAAGGLHHELLATLTNLHWFIAIAGLHLLAMLRFHPHAVITLRASAALTAAAVVAALSAPQLFSFAPVVIIGWVALRPTSRGVRAICTGFIAGISIQLATFLATAAGRTGAGQRTELIVSSLATVPEVLVLRLLLQNHVPPPWAEALRRSAPSVAMLLGVALCAVIVIAARKHRDAIFALLTLPALNVVLLAVARPEKLHGEPLSMLRDVSSIYDGRYHYAGYVCLLLLGAIAVSSAFRTRWLWLVAPVVALQIAAGAASFNNSLKTNETSGWRGVAREIRKMNPGTSLDFVIPPGIPVTLRKPGR